MIRLIELGDLYNGQSECIVLYNILLVKRSNRTEADLFPVGNLSEPETPETWDQRKNAKVGDSQNTIRKAADLTKRGGVFASSDLRPHLQNPPESTDPIDSFS